MLRFFLDENIPVEVARQLRAHGVEVLTVHELGRLGEDDEVHLLYTKENGYVLCTFDMDFVMLATNGFEHAGIVIGQPERHYIGEWVNWLSLMHAVYSTEDMQNRVEYLPNG